MFLDFDQLRKTSLNQSHLLVTQWLNGKQQGTEFVAYNPTRQDHRLGSFKINLESGQWADFASNDKGGDLISLYAYLNHLKYTEAAQELAQQLGVETKRPDPPQKHIRLGKPTQIWKYTEDFYVYRFNTKNGGKEFRPVSWNGEKWQWKDPQGPLPLYHLDQLQAEPQKGIMICEGEKAADAAQRFFPYHVTTTTAHGSQAPHKTDFSPLNNRPLLIWPDNDDVGQKYAQMIAQLALAAGVQSVHILQIPKHLPPKCDAADANGEDLSKWQWLEVKSHQPKVDTHWENQLQRNRYGKITNTKVNIRMILTHHPDWDGVIGYNELTHHVNKRKCPPYLYSPNNGLGGWTDVDNELLSMWFGENYGFEPSTRTLQSLIVAISMQNRFHPIRDYLKQCHDQWLRAGSPSGYATQWLERYLGAKETPATRLFEKTWLISAVARIFEPGCKADNVLILEGKTGLGKSTALSILGGSWFSDAFLNFGDKDSLMLIHDNWILEMPELDRFKKVDVDRAKSFFSKTIDKYRAPYGSNIIEAPRQCVFAGTTNTQDYLRDSTGNRRYMPVECLTKLDTQALQRDRDLIWGEAVDLYLRGEPWWYDDTLNYVCEAQEARFSEDVWQEVIEDYLEGRSGITIQLILTDCLKIPLERCTKLERNRVADILRCLDWRPDTHVFVEGKRRRGWKPK